MESTQTKPHAKSDPASDDLDLGVERSPVRCPYCHDRCGPEDEAAIVCQACLSRHHGACWREGESRCSSCGSSKALSSSAPEVAIAPAEMTLVERGLAREAVERLSRRAGISEAAATQLLLEAASHKLEQSRRLPPGAIVAIVAIVMVFSIPILAILLNR